MGDIRMEMMGGGEVKRWLDELVLWPEAIERVLQAGADVLLPAEQANAPVGPSGGTHIRDRLAIKIRSRFRNNQSAFVGVWDEPVAYYVEYGHGGPHPAQAHPYMKPTADEMEDQVVAAMLNELDAFYDDLYEGRVE